MKKISVASILKNKNANIYIYGFVKVESSVLKKKNKIL